MPGGTEQGCDATTRLTQSEVTTITIIKTTSMSPSSSLGLGGRRKRVGSESSDAGRAQSEGSAEAKRRLMPVSSGPMHPDTLAPTAIRYRNTHHALLRPADRVWLPALPAAATCVCISRTSLRSGSCTCLKTDRACILAAPVGQRLNR